MLHQQGLIAGGGNLRHKNNIVRIGNWLVFVGEVGVQGMSHLMNCREFTVKIVFVI